MTAPRMLLLVGGHGNEAFVAMPATYEKAVQVAQEKFAVPKDTHITRLSCNAHEIPYIGAYAGSGEVYLTDNDSYHYACAGKHVARLTVHVLDKNPKLGGGGGDKGVEGAGAGGEKGGEQGGDKAESGDKGGDKGGEKTAEQSLDIKKADGKSISITAAVSGDLAKGPPAGDYLGTMSISANSLNQKFIGQQLGPNEVLTRYVIHNKNTARLLFRPRSARPQIDILSPEEKSLEVSVSLADWQVLGAYPMTSLLPDDGRQRLRWFLRVKPGGIIEDLLTGTEASGLFMELLPAVKARPEKTPGPEDPLIPAWPDVRPQNAWCLPSSIFIAHIGRVLNMLGLPVESRTAMITSWLPSVTRQKNIAYRLLSPAQLAPSTALTIIPPPQVLLRIFVLFRGISDGEMKEWSNRGLLHAEMGLDWRGTIGWTPELHNEELFRVIEYGAMEVFE